MKSYQRPKPRNFNHCFYCFGVISEKVSVNCDSQEHTFIAPELVDTAMKHHTYHDRRLCRKQGGPVLFHPSPLSALSPLVSHPTAHQRASSPSSPPGTIAPLLMLSLSFFKFKQCSFGFCWKLYVKRCTSVKIQPTLHTSVGREQ